MAAVRHLGFVVRVLGPIIGGLYRCAQFDWNCCSTFDNMKVLIFVAVTPATLKRAATNFAAW